MLSLVEYENSDGEGDEEAEAEEENNKPGVGVVGVAWAAPVAAEAEAEIQAAISSSSSDDEDANEDENGGGGAGGLSSLLAAADDTVEESLRMRVPTSAQIPSAPTPAPMPTPRQAATRTPVLPPNPHLAGIRVVKRPAGDATRRRLIVLGADDNNDDDDDEDEDDEDVAKRRRVAAAAAHGGRLRGATSLLAQLPRPRALAVKEGGARLLVPAQAVTAAAAAAAARRNKPTAAATTSRQFDDYVDDEEPSAAAAVDHEQQQQHLLGSLASILPAGELHRYRQATGASLTADIASDDGGGGIVNIRQADQIAGSELQLAKDLTRNADADQRRSKPAGQLPSSLDKRKHQITYLAYQAQEREIELKNSWAEARFNKRSSQNKYGF